MVYTDKEHKDAVSKALFEQASELGEFYRKAQLTMGKNWEKKAGAMYWFGFVCGIILTTLTIYAISYII